VLSAGAHTLTITNHRAGNGSSSATTSPSTRRLTAGTPPTQTIIDGNVTGTGTNQFQYGANGV